MDIFPVSKRSEIKRRVKSTDTTPEVMTRRVLHSKGFRFRIHQASLPGKPDIVLKKLSVAIFINGCFWHGHSKCRAAKMPKSNLTYWTKKITGNQTKDKSNKRLLQQLGWKVYTIWRCQLKNEKIAEKTLEELVNCLHEIRQRGLT